MMLRSLFATALTATAALMSMSALAEDIDVQTAKQFWGVQFEELEYRYSDNDEDLGSWDGDTFYGTDELKVRWLTKGEYDIDEQAYEQLENQLVLQTPISTFFDAKAGVRFDTPEGPDRTYAVLGVAGLAPYWFEIDVSLYVGDDGKTSSEIDAEYELLFTNRLILTLGLDTTISFSEDKEIGIGRGLASTELGARLSYDVVDRAFSPYIGIVNERKYGDTEDMAKASGDSTDDWYAVIGAKVMF
ncbi:MAG: copper resistance protein CopB [Alteromonadaceae bacterium]|nr:copper resistance protein CopB [Alteromonadaceae bacterium]MBH85834.1 copper resistance protein CopB [Alteromonadaceae bacterium]|tara:strand:+ start:84 stop:818 length:735 start_codon:yes stop_codon:yes gene_type:complete